MNKIKISHEHLMTYCHLHSLDAVFKYILRFIKPIYKVLYIIIKYLNNISIYSNWKIKYEYDYNYHSQKAMKFYFIYYYTCKFYGCNCIDNK